MVKFDEGDLRGPADPAALAAAQSQLGLDLPTDYAAFVTEHDGADAWIGESRLVLWRLEDLAQRNAELEMEAYMPRLRLFGTDGAGESFAFDISSEPWSVVAVPAIGMADDAVVPIAPSFTIFLEMLASGWTVPQGLEAQRAAERTTR